MKVNGSMIGSLFVKDIVTHCMQFLNKHTRQRNTVSMMSSSKSSSTLLCKMVSEIGYRENVAGCFPLPPPSFSIADKNAFAKEMTHCVTIEDQ